MFRAVPEWTSWTKWSKCTVSCGLGSKSRERACVDKNNYNKPLQAGVDCLGPKSHTDQCEKKHCPGNICLRRFERSAEVTLNFLS